MADEQDLSKPKYTISKNENGRDIIHLDDVPSEREAENTEETGDFLAQAKEELQQLLGKGLLQNRTKELFILCLCMVILIVFLLGHNLRRFKDYDVKNSYERVDAAETSYVDFQDNLLRYSHDGAFYTDYDGDLIWNYTYEMSNPCIDICENYILIYDKKGTQMAILTNTGFKQSIQATLPIVDANISGRGTVAVLMQEGDTGYLQMCSDDGSVLASGELHMENNGYPMAIALSASGENLAVSQLDISNHDIKTNIVFYNFGKGGQEKMDNIINTYSFSGQIFPEITYLSNGKLVAFGSREVVLFQNNSKASMDKEIFVDGQIRSIFFDDAYFGTVCNTSDDKGNYICEMTIYNGNGFRRCQKGIDPLYTSVYMLSNHEVCFTNFQDTTVYTLLGIKKFSHTFESNVYALIPGDGSRRYYLIEEGSTKDVRLK